MELNGDSTYLYNIPPLKHDGSNYAAWKFRQRTVLRLYGLYDLVTGAEPMPDTHGETDASKVKAVADWTRRDMDAFAQIIQNMEDGALADVVECKTAHEAWTCITQRWERNKAESLFDLCQQLTNTKIGEDEELTPALNNLRSIASRMEMLGEPVSDMMLAHIIINALPPSYAVLGVIIQMSNQNHTISSNMVINAALVEEGRRKMGLGLDTQLPKYKANHKGQK